MSYINKNKVFDIRINKNFALMFRLYVISKLSIFSVEPSHYIFVHFRDFLKNAWSSGDSRKVVAVSFDLSARIFAGFTPDTSKMQKQMYGRIQIPDTAQEEEFLDHYRAFLEYAHLSEEHQRW